LKVFQLFFKLYFIQFLRLNAIVKLANILESNSVAL